MSNLKMKKINKVYQSGIHAVKDFDMEIQDGEFIVLVGPSGCGKSTMLRMIAGLETISDGELILGDRVLNKVAPADRNIAMVFQNYALFSHLSVYDNMGISLAILHEDKDEIHEKIMKATKIVNLKRELNRKPKQLSGGQRQRVALGRSIVRNADLFLMDEPLSNLDAKLRAQTRKEIVQLKDKLKTTFIYVTHDQIEAMTMADRIVVMNNGYVQQIGSPSELYDTPANVFVGGFIGSPAMNFMHGKIVKNEFISDDVSIKLSTEKVQIARKNDCEEVILGIRPEAFTLSNDSGNIVTAYVDNVEFLGNEYNVGFTFDQGPSVYVAKIDASDVKDKIDGRIKMRIDMEKVHLFDAISEERLV